jgi:hypothetical protein
MRIGPIARGLIGAGLLIAQPTAPALAQMPMPGITMSPDKGRVLTPEQKAKQKAIDDQYQATIKQIPEKRAPSDPWSNMRSSPSDSSRPR